MSDRLRGWALVLALAIALLGERPVGAAPQGELIYAMHTTIGPA